MAGLITRAGPSYTYKETKVVGKDNFINKLIEDTKLLNQIKKDVLDNIANINIPIELDPIDEENINE
jgi:hypothetical protein